MITRKTHKIIYGPEPFKGIDWDDRIILDVKVYGHMQNTCPVELHHLPNGAINNGPSFCIVSVDMNDNFYMGQISVDMLNKGLEEVGYKIVKL
jgi:hypothetical protein